MTGLTAYASRPIGIHLHQVRLFYLFGHCTYSRCFSAFQFADMVTQATASGFEPGNKTFATHWQGRGNATFGCPETNTFPGYRAGCLGNWNVNGAGVINQTKYFPAEQISNGFYTANDVEYSDASPIGLGMIVHANTDPCNGNSTQYGTRLAGGVVGVANRGSTSGATIARAYFAPGTNTITATCRFIGTSNATLGYAGIRGSVWLRQSTVSATQVRAVITGFPTGLGASGARSMHIHDVGDLTDLIDGLSVGGHWNPLQYNHALPPQEPRHQGDLGRITIANNQTNDLFYNYVLTSSDSANVVNHPQLAGMYSVLGRGMILHAGIDIGCQAATTNGAAGARAAQCVLGLARNEVWDELLTSWPTLAPAAAQSITPQPGDICSAPVKPAAPGAAGSASGVFASFLLIAVAAVCVLFF